MTKVIFFVIETVILSGSKNTPYSVTALSTTFACSLNCSNYKILVAGIRASNPLLQLLISAARKIVP